MDLVGLKVELNFAEDSRVRTPANAVFTELADGSGPRRGPQEPGVRVKNSKQKMEITWDYESCSVLWEDPSDPRYTIKESVKFLNRIDKVVSIPKLKDIQLTAYWILPVKGDDFKSLESKYRNRFIRENEAYKNCLDSSVIIDMQCQNRFLHHQSGPMRIKQFQDEYRSFKVNEGTPHLFFFLETTIIDSEIVKYSNSETEAFLLSLFKECKSHSDKFHGVVEDLI